MTEQVPVLFWIAVYVAPWLVDDPFVSKVGYQGVIIRGKRARAGDNCQSQDVMIVGAAYRGGTKALFLVSESFTVCGSQLTHLLQSNQQTSHGVAAVGQFLPEFARSDESRIATLAR